MLGNISRPPQSSIRYSDMIRFQRDRPGAPRVRGAWEAVAAWFELDGSFAIFELLMFCSIIA